MARYSENKKRPKKVVNKDEKRELEKKKAANKKSASKGNETSAASYDLDEFEQRSLHGELIYKKKEDKK